MGNFMDPKYRKKPSERAEDFIAKLIDDQCRVQTEDKKGTRLDCNALIQLAANNNLDAEKFRDQIERPNAPGRIRMSVGSMLRAAAKRRGGLYDIAGTWIEASAEFPVNDPITENKDGTLIVLAKAETPEAKDEANDDPITDEAEDTAKNEVKSTSKKKAA